MKIYGKFIFSPINEELPGIAIKLYYTENHWIIVKPTNRYNYSFTSHRKTIADTFLYSFDLIFSIFVIFSFSLLNKALTTSLTTFLLLSFLMATLFPPILLQGLREAC